MIPSYVSHIVARWFRPTGWTIDRMHRLASTAKTVSFWIAGLMLLVGLAALLVRAISSTASGRRAHRHAGDLFRPILAEVEKEVGTDEEQTRGRLLALHQIVDTMRNQT